MQDGGVEYGATDGVKSSGSLTGEDGSISKWFGGDDVGGDAGMSAWLGELL